MLNPPPPIVDDADEDAPLIKSAHRALDLQQWAQARDGLLQLATRWPDRTRYRALLAYARGHESLVAGDEARARTEWRRALTLDPSLQEASRALAARPRPRSWVDRLLGRA